MSRWSRQPDGSPTWLALFSLIEGSFYSAREYRRITIERVVYEKQATPVPYYYVSTGVARVGTFPGTDSDEWIEYVPPLPEVMEAIW